MQYIKMKHALMIATTFSVIFLFAFRDGGEKYQSIIEFIKNAPPNELGDFLAGIFSPLAFVWLIFGYFLQSQELSLQRKEIEAQRKELEKGNKSSALQLKFIEEQTKNLRAKFVPRFTVTSRGTSAGETRYEILNTSGIAINLEIETDFGFVFSAQEFHPKVSTGFNLKNSKEAARCVFNFYDESGRQWIQLFNFNGQIWKSSFPEEIKSPDEQIVQG